VDLWSKEAWEDILNRKKKYKEFCNLIGKAPLQLDSVVSEYGNPEEEEDRIEDERENNDLEVEDKSDTNTVELRQQKSQDAS
jgi:hypothetical protein